DYLTNYYIEKGLEYNSAWHVTSIQSMVSREKINITYEEKEINYNASKNWNFSFPNFLKTENFSTTKNPDLGIHIKPTEWRNGFAELTYSMSEVFVKDPIVKTINNHRGKEAKFYYEQ